MTRTPPHENKSAERRAFEHYLRTGRRLISCSSAPAHERKFNPYHDPRDGRFTFAPGGPKSLQNPLFSDRRGLWKPKEKKPRSAVAAARLPHMRERAQREGSSTPSNVGNSTNGTAPAGGTGLPLREVQTADLAVYLPVNPRANGPLLKISETDENEEYANCSVGGDCRPTASISPKNSDEIQLVLNQYRMSIRDHGWKDNDFANLVDIRYALYTLMEREAIAAQIKDWDPTRLVSGEWIAENAIDFDRDDPQGATRAFAYFMTLGIDGPGPRPDLLTLDNLMDPQQALLEQAEWGAKEAVHQSYQRRIGPDPIFAATEPVEVRGIRATDRGGAYEEAIRELYGAEAKTRPPRFTIFLDGKVISGQADHLEVLNGQATAIDAKYTDSWMGTLRNPLSVIGVMPWSEKEQKEMVEQARRYAAVYDGGVVYHTNSFELARFYSHLFDDAKIARYKFVITPIR